MKRLLIICLIIMGCGSGPDANTIDTPIIDTVKTNTAPVLIDVVILDSFPNNHEPPEIWYIGENWNFELYFNDKEKDVDSAIAYLYDPDTMDAMWGPYLFEISPEIDSTYYGGDVMATTHGLWVVGFIIIDTEGNESNELYRDVRIRN